MDSFIKIIDGIENGNIKFHASGLHYMNDSSEFIYGFKELRRLLPSIEQKIGNITKDLQLSHTIDYEDKLMNGSWNKEYVDMLLEMNSCPFVVSTSSNSDSIPMWAMYGDKGRGVSIGLDVANLLSPIKKSDGTLYMNLTKYDWKSIRAFKVTQHLSLGHPAILYSMNIYKRYIAKAIQGNENLTNLKLRALYEMSIFTSTLVKHPAFKFENEWRIFCMADSSNKICYKTNSKGELTPYIEVRIPIAQLKKIVIAPCNKETYQKNMIENFLLSKGITDCKVIISKVPYKG